MKGITESEKIKMFFENFSNDVKFIEKKWFNGHAYLPLFQYQVQRNNQNSSTIINYEFRSSEFSNSTSIDGGAYNDRHLVDIQFKSKELANFTQFEIVESSLIQKVLSKSSFSVKSNDKDLIAELISNPFLKDLFSIKDPEFSPIFKSELVDNNFLISIVFNLKNFNQEIFVSIFNFLDELAKSKY